MPCVGLYVWLQNNYAVINKGLVNVRCLTD